MIWENHPTTNSQKKRYRKSTQRDLILGLLRESRAKGESLPLPKILETRVAQFTPRIYELRKRGFVIENEMRHVEGVVHSSYRLTHDPERDGER